MKQHLLGIAVAAITLVVGTLASGVFVPQQIVNKEVDPFVYPVELLDLVSSSAQFDGKIVRVRGSFGLTQNSTVGFLETGSAWVRTICVADEATCSSLILSAHSTNVEVVGRYRSAVADPHPGQRGDKVRLLEISKLVSVQPVGRGTGQGTGRGSGRGSGSGSGNGSGVRVASCGTGSSISCDR